MMSLYLVIDQYGPNSLSAAVVHRVLVAQALEDRPHGVGLEAVGPAHVDLVERRGPRLGGRLLQRHALLDAHCACSRWLWLTLGHFRAGRKGLALRSPGPVCRGSYLFGSTSTFSLVARLL